MPAVELGERDDFAKLTWALLQDFGWSVRETTGSWVRAAVTDGAPVTFVLPGSHEECSALDGIVVRIHNDSRQLDPALAEWSTLPALAAAAAREESGEFDIRLGWDIAFGRTEGIKSIAGQVEASWAEDAGVAPDSFSFHALLRSGTRAETSTLSASELCPPPLSPRHRHTLLLYDGVIAGVAASQPALLFSFFIAPHLKALLSDEPGTKKATVLPLMIGAEDIRSETLQTVVRRTCTTITGLSPSAETANLLLRNGYFHLYVTSTERLRIDDDLDPNSQYVSELISALGPTGAMTLVCPRALAVHDYHMPLAPPDDDPDWAIGRLQALGQRFFFDERFWILDAGAPDSTALGQIATVQKEILGNAAQLIADNTGGRCSPSEIEDILTTLALLAKEFDGEVFGRSDIRDAIAMTLTGSRLRPVHISFVAAAISKSPLLATFTGGRACFRDPALMSYLIARAIGTGMQMAELTGNIDRLSEVLAYPLPDLWTLRLACHLGLGGELEQIIATFRLMMNEYGLYIGPPPNRTMQAENTLRLFLTALDYLGTAQDMDIQRKLLKKVCGKDGLIALNMSLPQCSFIRLPLEKWQFVNCNLRACAFLDCDLRQTGFEDCFMGGTAISGCDIGKYTRFTKSNLSGLWLAKGKGLEDYLHAGGFADRKSQTVWLAGLIQDDALTREELPKAIDTLAMEGGIVTELTVAGDEDAGRLRTEVPDDVWFGMLECLWRETPILRKSGRESQFQRKDKFVQGLEKLPAAMADAVNAQVPGPDGGTSGYLVSLANGEIHLITEDSRELTRLTGDTGRQAAKISVPPLWQVRQDKRFCAALHALPGHGDEETPSVTFLDQTWTAGEKASATTVSLSHKQADITASAWIGTGTGKHPAFIAGLSNGAVLLLAEDTAQNQWKLETLAEPNGTPVEALGIAPRDQVITAVYRGGLIVGLRRSSEGRAHELFRFQTALHRTYRAITLFGRPDQVLIIGAPKPVEGEIAVPVALCVLLTSSGDVLAVFPRPITIPADTDIFTPEVVEREETAADMQADRTLNLLDQYDVHSDRMEIRPLVYDHFLLRVSGGEDAEKLDSVIEAPSSSLFRTMTVTITPLGEDMEPLEEASIIYNEHDLMIHHPQANQLTIEVPSVFARTTDRARVTLRIVYASSSRDRLEKSWDIDAAISWRDNPYEASGRPARGAQFHGRGEEIERAHAALAKGGSVVVRAARRMGKTSFLSELADRLSIEGHIAVDISLQGTDSPREAMRDLIRESLYKRLPASLADRFAAEIQRSPTGGTSLFRTLAAQSRIFNYKSPMVILIDEWGTISNPANTATFSSSFVFELGELLYNQSTTNADIAVCLASAPADFANPTDDATSDPYRAVATWIDLGPLSDQELRLMMTGPIEERGGIIEDPDKVFGALLELSSGDAYGANVVMSHAYNQAMARMGTGEDSSQVVIKLEDLDSPQAREALRQLYAIHRSYTVDKLSQTNREKLFAEATQIPPPWEKDPPSLSSDGISRDERQWSVFGSTGFRRARTIGRNGHFELWIPRGMSYGFQTYSDDKKEGAT